MRSPRINPSARAAAPCCWKRRSRGAKQSPRDRSEPPGAAPCPARSGSARRLRGSAAAWSSAQSGARRSAAPECAWGLEGGVGSTHGGDPILMQFRASFAFLFSFLHQINARLLPLPSRELLTLRSQHLCTCQPLRSRRRCRLLSFPWARVALRAAERRNVSPRQREGSAGKAGR